MAYIKEAEGFLAKLPSLSLEGMEPLAPQSASKEQMFAVKTQAYKGVQSGLFTFPGFEQQAAAEQKHPMAPSNSQFSPNSTLFPLSSIESYDSGSARSQVGLISNAMDDMVDMNDMSSCESDSGPEDPSLRRSLRGAGRKTKATKEKRKVGRPIAYCGDPNSPDLTPAERRRIKRRIANRESARRVRARRQDMIEEMAIKAREMEDQNMQLANHAIAVEQQHAAMMAQLGEFNQQLQQTTVENEQLAKEISSLRNAVNSSMVPAHQPKEAVGDHVQPAMPMPKSPVNHSSNASAFPSASMPCNTQGLQSAPSFGNGLRSAFMQSASTALPDMPEAAAPLFDFPKGFPKGFSKGFSLAPSMDQLMPNFDPLGMSLNDFLLGEAC